MPVTYGTAQSAEHPGGSPTTGSFAVTGITGRELAVVFLYIAGTWAGTDPIITLNGVGLTKREKYVHTAGVEGTVFAYTVANPTDGTLAYSQAEGNWNPPRTLVLVPVEGAAGVAGSQGLSFTGGSTTRVPWTHDSSALGGVSVLDAAFHYYPTNVPTLPGTLTALHTSTTASEAKSASGHGTPGAHTWTVDDFNKAVGYMVTFTEAGGGGPTPPPPAYNAAQFLPFF